MYIKNRYAPFFELNVMNGSITPVPYPNDYARTVLSRSKVSIVFAPIDLLESFCSQRDEGGYRRVDTALGDKMPQPWNDDINYHGHLLRPLDTELSNVSVPTPIAMTLGPYRFLLSFFVSVSDEKQPWFAVANCRVVSSEELDIEPINKTFCLPRFWTCQRHGRIIFVWVGMDQDIRNTDIIHRFGSDFNPDNRTFVLNYSFRYGKYSAYMVHLFYHDDKVYAAVSPPEDARFATVTKLCDGPTILSLLKQNNVLTWEDAPLPPSQ